MYFGRLRGKWRAGIHTGEPQGRLPGRPTGWTKKALKLPFVGMDSFLEVSIDVVLINW